MQIVTHDNRRGQQHNKIGVRRLSLVGSRAGQAIEDTQKRKSGPIKAIPIKAIPGSCLHSERRPKSCGARPWENSFLSRALLSRRRFLRTRL